MPNLCECGKLHYDLEDYFSVHGNWLGNVREHRQQVEILPNGKVFDPKKQKNNVEFPILTTAWICKFCGNFNTTSASSSHKNNCPFIKYLA